MRDARPCLTLSESPSFNTPFYADPWPRASPSSESSPSDCYGSSPSSSRTNSSYSHVVPESAFLSKAGDGSCYIVDPYFGYKDVAILCTTYLVKTFHCHEETESSKQLGQPKLPIFIAQLMHITGVPLKVVVAALILLQRFHTVQPQANNSASYSGHRLFIGALILACNDDHLQDMVSNARSAAYWSEISLFSETDLDDVFNSIYDELDGNVVVFPSYAAALEKLNNPVSINSFEGDLQDFIDADSDDELNNYGDDNNNDTSASELRSSPAQNEVAKIVTPKTQHSSVRTRIASLFGKRSKPLS